MICKITLLPLILLSFMSINAQKIINVVYVNANGITNDINNALSVIIVKQYPDHFERLDYKMFGPLVKRRSYIDADLEILNGNYYEYRPNGTILYWGYYKDNKKQKTWMTFNDSGQIIRSEKYEMDNLIETKDINKKDSLKTYGDEKEAGFPGGNKAWSKYLIKSLEKSQPANTKGGSVMVYFIVGIDGYPEEVFVSKSVEFNLDEQSIEIILNSPKWKPAWQNGHALRAYRLQPITFSPSE